MENSNAYDFRPMKEDDLPMIQRWLSTPEVVRWWGDAEEQFDLVSGDLGDSRMEQWIVSYRGVPFAYTQAYTASAWPQSHLEHLPPQTKIIDAFIGESFYLGRGHGQTMLNLFSNALISRGAPAVAIDPAADNLRARHAYANAGFDGDTVIETDDGAVVVMVFNYRPLT